MKTFTDYHLTVLMTYFLTVLMPTMFVWNPVIQLTALCGGICYCALLTGRKMAAHLGFYLPLFLLVAVTNPLFSHNGVTPLFFLNGNPVTVEAFAYGGAIAVMVIAVLLWCQCYSAVMTSDKFLYLFGRLIPKISLVLSIALRFIPLYRRQVRQVSRAQQAMVLYAGESRLDRLRGRLRVFLAMIAWSTEHAMETYSSMQARGYGGKNRTNFSLFRFYPHDAILLTATLLLAGVTIWGIAAGKAAFSYYPAISPLPCSARSILTYTAFGVISFLPFLIEGWETIRWRCAITSYFGGNKK